MIKIFNDRMLALDQSVHCYRNLNVQSGKVFSIKDKKTGLVAAHGESFRIEMVKCHVGKGIHKIREKKQKSVVAWLSGIYTGECEMDTSQMDEVYFNPYTLDSFINNRTGESLQNIDLVYFQDGKAFMNKT